MIHERAVTRALHDEHMAALALLERLDTQVIAHINMPDDAAATLTPLLHELKAAINTEIVSHFAFEEEALFPRLADNGAGDMRRILLAEHEILVPLATELTKLIEGVLLEGFTAESWGTLRQTAQEFSERLQSHIGKEEMGLLPFLEEILDDMEDRDLFQAYKLDS